MKKCNLIFLILMILSLGQTALSQEMYRVCRPVSALGMGNTYLPFVEDTNAVLQNPAALSRVEQITWEVLNGGGGVGVAGMDPTTAQTFINSIQGQTGATAFNNLYGKPLWTGLSAQTTFTTPNFGFAAFDCGSFSASLNNPAFPTMDSTLLNDYGLALGVAFQYTPFTSVGMSVKAMNRLGGTLPLGPGVVSSGSMTTVTNQFQNQGRGYGIDIGSETRITTGTLTNTFAISWQNVGGTSFAQTAGAAAPDHIPDNLSVGLGMESKLPGFDWKLGLEYNYINDNNTQYGKKVHIGTEFGLPFIDLRAGVNQGYTTYGAGFSLGFMKIDAASYVEEIGVYPGQTPESRFQVGLGIELAVDADFKFTTKDGKRRKLKQRR